MTEERDANKVRKDVVKLQTARAAFLQQKQSYPRCYCVVNGDITRAMRDAGTPHRINVLSFAEFTAIFFDFQKYKFARDRAAFGSAINTVTGQKDDRRYIPVTYLIDGTSNAQTLKEIAELLIDGKRLVLLGEYGTGKSRCYGELFKLLESEATTRNLYPLALNLRESWGLRRASESLPGMSPNWASISSYRMQLYARSMLREWSFCSTALTNLALSRGAMTVTK